MAILYVGSTTPIQRRLLQYCERKGTTLHVLERIDEWEIAFYSEGRATRLMLREKSSGDWIDTQSEISGVWFHGMPQISARRMEHSKTMLAETRACLSAAFGSWMRPIINRPATPAMKRCSWGLQSMRRYLQECEVKMLSEEILPIKYAKAIASVEEYEILPILSDGFQTPHEDELALCRARADSANLIVVLLGYETAAYWVNSGQFAGFLPGSEIPKQAIRAAERLADYGIEEFLTCRFRCDPGTEALAFIGASSDIGAEIGDHLGDLLSAWLYSYLTEIHSPHFPRTSHGWSRGIDLASFSEGGQ